MGSDRDALEAAAGAVDGPLSVRSRCEVDANACCPDSEWSMRVEWVAWEGMENDDGGGCK